MMLALNQEVFSRTPKQYRSFLEKLLAITATKLRKETCYSAALKVGLLTTNYS